MAAPPSPLSPAAQKIVQPGQTPCQQAQALNQKELSHDAVKAMAHGLPEHQATQWAAASAEKVANPAHPTDFQAIQAAKAWCQNPTPQAQHLAAEAAMKAGHQTPGAWAAQAAAWAGKGGGLTANAAGGAVMLAAAQAGKPIPPPGAPKIETPKIEGPKLAEPALPKAPKIALPFVKKPELPKPEVPEVPHVGPDGLKLTPTQRTAMAKNCDPFLKLGCEIGGRG